MAEIKVLIPGYHARDDDEKLRISSSAILIKSNKNIIVDTASFLEKDNLINELKKENLTPKDIDIVILTHMHFDHMMNTNLFENAKIFCKLRKNYPGQFHNIKEGYLQRSDLFENTEIAKDVKILLTPGHTEDMISLLVETSKGKVAIAGDAIPDEKSADPNTEVNPNFVSDVEDFKKSRDKILKIADYIIPGHGDMFKVNK
ncbi:MAG: MBL fold metallo-hydrolase [archaeon]